MSLLTGVDAVPRLLRLPTAPYGFFFLMRWWSVGASAQSFAALQLSGQSSHRCHRPPQAYCNIVFSTRLIYFPIAVLKCMRCTCIYNVTAERPFRQFFSVHCVTIFCLLHHIFRVVRWQLLTAPVWRLSLAFSRLPL